MQWKGIDWKVLQDPINLLNSAAVPLFVAIDEHGVVRSTSPTPEWVRNEFLKTDYPKPLSDTSQAINSADLTKLRSDASQNRTTNTLRALGDGLLLWGSPDDIDVAIETYEQALAVDEDNAITNFRLGVAYRARYDSASRRPKDFQKAAEHWLAALDANPNQYIYRRRIQQYGPRLDKPYSFYDWVHVARKELKAAGKTPHPISVEPVGAEFAEPAKKLLSTENQAEPDPKARIRLDRKSMVIPSVVVVPPRIEAGKSAQVHIEFETFNAKWSNEAGMAVVWIPEPDGWTLSQQRFELPRPKLAESSESRRIDFEVLVSPNAKSGTSTIEGYILYYACHNTDGVCIYGRRDIKIPITITGSN